MDNVSQAVKKVKQKSAQKLLPVTIIPIPLTPAETPRVYRQYAATFLPNKPEVK